MPPETDLTAHSAATLRALMGEGTLSAVAVLDAFLARIARLNPELNAICTLSAEAARAAARDADAAFAAGRPIGPLHGLPLVLKDLTPTAGLRTTRGSRLFAEEVPAEDAPLARRLKAAGAVILGKTNTPEFGHKGETDNRVFGPTRNPWAPDRTPGGSSGGAAAAVAAGLVPFAEGSDGAGSIRIPAALCGVFGFKPSWGRVPDVAGPFSSHTPFLHNGPIAARVADACLLYDAMAGPDPDDPFAMPADAPVLPELDAGVAGLRLGFSPDLGLFPVEAEIREACRAAAERFREAGCVVEDIAVGLDAEAEAAMATLWRVKLAGLWGDLPEAEQDLLEPAVRRLIAEGRRVDAVAQGRAVRAREAVWRRFRAVFRRCDLLLCPTTAVPAFPIAAGAPSRVEGRPVDPLLGWFLTWPFNLTGDPAATVPCGVSREGLPIGLQIVGPRLADARVLRAARLLERIAPWPRLAPGG